MKYIIAHRGNVDGPNPCCENTIPHIEKALSLGFDVEIDVWGIYEFGVVQLYLGHDEPCHNVDKDWMLKNKNSLWCHAKNLCSLEWLCINDFHCFFHDRDAYTLTSKKIIWAYPSSIISNNTIYVMPENNGEVLSHDIECLGVCTDFANSYVRYNIDDK